MAKVTNGMPSINSNGNTRDVYSLVKVLTEQVLAINPTIEFITEDTDAVDGKVYIVTTPGVGAMNLTLPLAAENEGAIITAIKVAGGASLSVVLTGSDTLNGQGFGTDLDSPYDRIKVISSGLGWLLLDLVVA